MTEAGKPTQLRDAHRIELTFPPTAEAASAPQEVSRTAVDALIASREEVAKSDHEEFQDYLREKQAHALAVRAEAPSPPENAPSRVTRRGMLKVAAGTEIAGGTAALGYNVGQRGGLGTFGAAATGGSQSPGNTVVAEAQHHPISRELIDSKADVGGRSLGKCIALLPTKLGGPSADPYNGFEFINSTQGGKNCLIYGLPTNIAEPAPGFNIYHVRYDGAQMQVMENVSETTGLGLSVHVTINPKDA